MISISQLQEQVHKLAREKGWWPFFPEAAERSDVDLSEVNIPEKLMLMVSEIWEALEFYRNDNLGFGINNNHMPIIYSTENPDKPDGFWVELADTVIRILDLAGAYDIDMEALIKEKHEYNKTRPYRHGNKKC